MVLDYQEWETSVLATIANDVLWRVQAYRLSLFVSELAWQDATRLLRDRRTIGLSDQLYRAVGSIGANIAEGYSRGIGKDRARFYEYALGSARESRDWYYKARHVLGETATVDRLDILAKIIRLLLTMVPQQRQRMLQEEPASYNMLSDDI